MKIFLELVGLFLFVAMCCAMCGGVTVNGKHHEIRLDTEKGVTIE